jgi:hypothetical protein
MWPRRDKGRDESEMTRLELSNRKALLDVRICDLDRAIKDKEDDLEYGRGYRQREDDGWYYSDSGLALCNEIAGLKLQLNALELECDELEFGTEIDDAPRTVAPPHTGAVFGRIGQ